MEITQTTLVIVIVVLTAVLSLIGIEVFFILKEVQQSVKKINKVLDDGGVVSGSVASLVDRVVGVSGIAGLLGWLASRRKKREEKENG